MGAKSEILNPEIQALRVKRSTLVTELAEAKKDHDVKENKARAANRVSMNSYYKVKELESAIDMIDQSIETLNSVEKDRW